MYTSYSIDHYLQYVCRSLQSCWTCHVDDWHD